MTIEELLKNQNLTPEQIAAVVKGMQENHISILTAEQEKNLKDYETLVSEHEKLMEEYAKSVSAADQLKENAEKAKSELNRLNIDVQVKDALKSAKVKDMDYAMFKLLQSGELNLGEDGKVDNLESRVKELVAAIPDNFSPAQESTKSVVERKPASFDQSGSAFEPHNLNEALQDVYSNEN